MVDGLKHRDYNLTILRAEAVIPETSEDCRMACVIYDELTNLAQGRGIQLGGAAHNGDDGRWVINVSGTLDLVAMAQRILKMTVLAEWQANRRRTLERRAQRRAKEAT